MTEQPLVCICIPHFNNKDTISQTLDSLLSQTYNNIIIKVFDNISDDGSWEVVKQYAKKYSNIHEFQNSENIGGEANFTKCIQGLEGRYGAIYHADDLYHPLMVEMQVKYLLENDISAIFVRANIIDDRSENIGEQFFPNEIKKNDYYQFNFKKLFSLILKYDNFLITPSVMARVDLYQQQVKSFNGEVFKTSADLDVWLRFSLIRDVGIITKKLISYRLSKSSYTYSTKFTRVLPRDMFLVTDYYLDKYKQLNFNLSDYQYLMFKDHIMVISNRIFNGNLVKSDEIKLGNLKVISRLLCSKQKTKVYIYALLIKIGLYFNANKILLKFVTWVNTIPTSIK
jgi:glycosyltransferase involved in cell wall biosynthesis